MTGSNLILINAISRERRVAVVEGGALVEFYAEHPEQRSIVGNIYKGRVVRVLPGMQAAFVDIGLEKAAFLYVADALPPRLADVEAEEHANGEPPAESQDNTPDIAQLLRTGDEVVVQVKKAPLGTKGARITTHITLPGRSLVFMPFNPHIGISRRIVDEAERERLRAVLTQVRGAAGWGLIARTVAEGVAQARFERELELQRRIWEGIDARLRAARAPALVHEDLDLVLRAVRDILDEDIGRVIVDTPAEHARLGDFLRQVAPARVECLELYGELAPLFDRYGVEAELERAMDRKVWLKSGGYIVLDPTEALTVIDVNTGKFVGHHSLEQTITQINIEAVKEVATQLRLRNIGGIVIIDFIDMEEQYNRDKVLGALDEVLRRDRARTYLAGMSELGLVQLTRKRYQEPLGMALTAPCPYCGGRGRIRSVPTMAHMILRDLQRYMTRDRYLRVLVNMHRAVADYFYEQETEAVALLEERSGAEIIFVARREYHEEQFDILATPRAPAAGAGGHEGAGHGQ